MWINILFRIILCLILFFCLGGHHVNADSNECLSSCKLEIQNERLLRNNFLKRIQSEDVKIVRFLILVNGDTSFNITGQTNQYAWVRANGGEPLLSLPLPYVSGSFYLPFIFRKKLKVDTTDTKSGCFQSANQHCQHYMIFDALIRLTNTAACN